MCIYEGINSKHILITRLREENKRRIKERFRLTDIAYGASGNKYEKMSSFFINDKKSVNSNGNKWEEKN